MNKQAPSFPRIAAMVVFALSCFGLLLFLWLSFGGAVPLKPKGYRFEIAFPEATQLAVEADVRVAGVPVGKVRAKRVDKEGGNLTVATVELDRKYAPIAKDARATLREKTVLGETYVELTTGSQKGPFLAEGERLANDRVEGKVELDELLNALDPFTRQLYRTWQQDLGAAIQGRGRDLNDAFGSLPGFVESGGDLFETLDTQKQVLQQLVRNTGVTFRALTAREDRLRQLITSQDDVFTAIANERENFAATWRIFPTYLDESKITLRRLQEFSRQAEPVVRDLEPAFEDLGPALADVGDLAPDLQRFFVNFDQLIDVSRESLPASREVFDGLRPVLGELNPWLQQVNPILSYLGLHIYTLSDMFANLGVATAAKVGSPRGGNGHYLRQFGTTGAESIAINPNRVSTNRGNAFLGPLGQLNSPTAQKHAMLQIPWDCTHIGGPKPPTDTPSCRVQPPINFQGLAERFPRIDRADYSKTDRNSPDDTTSDRTEGKDGGPGPVEASAQRSADDAGH